MRSEDHLQRRVAGALQRRGVGPGERVVLLTGNDDRLPHVALACLRIGVIPVPLNPALHADTVRSLIIDASPALVVADEAHVALAERAAVPWVLLDDLGERPAEPDSLSAWPLCRPMHYTSGTTGRTKGVYSGVLGPDLGRALWEDEIAAWSLRRDDVHLVCSPLYHSAPLRFAIATLLAGGRVVVAPFFDAADVVERVTTERVTTTFMGPTQLRRIVDQPGLGRADLGSVRLLAHAGGPCAEASKRGALEVFPPGSVWEFYGSTEGQFTQIGPQEWLERPHSVGRPRSGRTLFVIDDAGAEAPPGAIGTVYCTPPPFGRFEYWRDVAKTAAAWRGDAFTVGDLGALDDEGYLRLAGRRGDLILTGGVNVYPAEVERVLLGHPAVGEGIVFGAPDEEWGERVCAVVVPATGAQIDPAEVRSWLRERLAGFQTPKEVHVVDELPRTGSGKVLRRGIAAALGLQEGTRLDTMR